MAILTVAAAIGLSACFSSAPRQAPTTASPTPSPAAATASPATSAGATDPPTIAATRRWYPVAVAENGSDLYGPATMTAFARLPHGFLAVGSGPWGTVDWTSEDGLAWKRTEFLSRVLQNADVVALAVESDQAVAASSAPNLTQIVAAGSISDLSGSTRPALWNSATPGGAASLARGSWSLVADPLAGSSVASVGYMAGVVATAGGFVAVGVIDQQGYIWRSTDGATWSEASVGPSMAGVDLRGLMAGPGGLLVTGKIFGGTSSQDTTWVSTDDGKTWTGSAFPTAHLDTVTSDTRAYWAFGEDADPSGGPTPAARRAFRSIDGIHWESLGTLPAGSVSVALAVVTSSGEQVVVAVTDGAQLRPTSALYASRDGRTWVPDGPSRPDARFAALATTSASIVAIGARYAPSAAASDVIVSLVGAGERPAAWVALPADVAAPPAPPAPIVRPAGWCPPQPVDLAAILSLGSADRLRCFGSRPLSLSAFLANPGGFGGTFVGTTFPSWLTGGGLGFATAFLAPLAGPWRRTESLPAFARPTVAGASPPPSGRWVTVIGHFDDPASTTCRITKLDGSPLVPVATAVAQCRRSFVLTGIEPAHAGDPATELGIAAPYAIEPNDGGIDGAAIPREAVGFGIAEVWLAGGPVATVLIFRTSLSAKATAAFNDRLAKGYDVGNRRSILGVPVSFASSVSGGAVFTVGHLTLELSATNGLGLPLGPPSEAFVAVVTALIQVNR